MGQEAAIAQLGERQTEDLEVPGSIPGYGMFIFNAFDRFTGYHVLVDELSSRSALAAPQPQCHAAGWRSGSRVCLIQSSEDRHLSPLASFGCNPEPPRKCQFSFGGFR